MNSNLKTCVSSCQVCPQWKPTTTKPTSGRTWAPWTLGAAAWASVWSMVRLNCWVTSQSQAKARKPELKPVNVRACVAGKLYAVGGYDGASRQCLSTVEEYDPATNQWCYVADMSTRRSGAGRHTHTLSWKEVDICKAAPTVNLVLMYLSQQTYCCFLKVKR